MQSSPSVVKIQFEKAAKLRWIQPRKEDLVQAQARERKGLSYKKGSSLKKEGTQRKRWPMAMGTSQFNSPIARFKGGGTLRFCGDYKYFADSLAENRECKGRAKNKNFKTSFQHVCPPTMVLERKTYSLAWQGVSTNSVKLSKKAFEKPLVHKGGLGTSFLQCETRKGRGGQRLNQVLHAFLLLQVFASSILFFFGPIEQWSRSVMRGNTYQETRHRYKYHFHSLL